MEIKPKRLAWLENEIEHIFYLCGVFTKWSKIMNNLIVIRNPDEELSRRICAAVPCIGNNDDIIIPFDAQDMVIALGIEYQIITYRSPYATLDSKSS